MKCVVVGGAFEVCGGGWACEVCGAFLTQCNHDDSNDNYEDDPQLWEGKRVGVRGGEKRGREREEGRSDGRREGEREVREGSRKGGREEEEGREQGKREGEEED